MPKRLRPVEAKRSEHWLRVAVNDVPNRLDECVARTFQWDTPDKIHWLSPLPNDQFAEYYDQAFLERLGLSELRVSLGSFWPASGPRWDGLGKTASGEVILVAAKAHIDEVVDFKSW
jgi:hypothetical protein